MKRSNTFRTRLILSFLAVVFLSLSGLSLMLMVSGIRTAQLEINRQLATVANYKSKAIEEWANTLKAELGNVLVGESTQASISNLFEILADPEARSAEVTAASKRLRVLLLENVSHSKYYHEYFVLNPNGTVVVATVRSREGETFASTDLLENGKENPYIERPYYTAEQDFTTVIFSSYPIRNADGQIIGILAGRARLDPVDSIFSDKTGLLGKSKTFFLGQDGAVLTGSDNTARGKVYQDLLPALAQLQPKALAEPGVMSYNNLAGLPATGAYQSLPSLHGVLLIEQEREDILRGWVATLAVNLSVTLSSVMLALFIALLATRSIAGPIAELADIASQIAKTAARQEAEAGAAQHPQLSASEESSTHEIGGAEPAITLIEASQELEQRASNWGDELGQLAYAFDGMAVQLSGLIGSLEQKVDERTRELEARSRYLEASADVARATTSMLDPDKLLEQAVELIRDRFDLYYVGLFLADTDGQWAVLRAGTGSAGRIMLERKHCLRIEPASMIGWCMANAQARIAQLASQDEVRYATPELPETRSEAALPLRARGQVIGAISVQSSQFNAFDQATVAVLQTMADQLAIAIDNALLFAQSRQALEAERRAYALSTLSDWRELFRNRTVGGKGLSLRAAYDPGQPQGLVHETSQDDPCDWYPEMQEAYKQDQNVVGDDRLAIPIRVRGTVIGVVNATRRSAAAAGQNGWVTDEVAFLERVADQLGLALDSARLYAETRQRAEQERLVDRVTSQMRATLDIETVLETATRELRDALSLAEVEVRLGNGIGRNGRHLSGENKNEK